MTSPADMVLFHAAAEFARLAPPAANALFSEVDRFYVRCHNPDTGRTRTGAKVNVRLTMVESKQ
jgi:hypothetical protein